MKSHPFNDEIEVSIFGPGIGESIVIHLGDREWIIIDSCRDKNKKPIALEYLKSLGVDLSTEVKLVVSSHWHDDHIKGLSEIFNECSSASFSCAVSLLRKEFLTLVKTYGKDPLIKHKGVKEFSNIFSILEKLPDKDPRKTPIWAIENTTLLTNDKYNLIALSPSNAAISQCLKDIAALLPKPHEAKKDLMMENANLAAVVITVNVGVWNILLASDMQINSNPSMGWSAIINSKGRVKSKAQILKIPHHGSGNGDSEELWNQLLEQNPIGIVTPYNRGPLKLPSDSDLKRIGKKCSNLYYTNLPLFSVPKRRAPTVERTINETAVNRRVVKYKMGHVRLRNKINDTKGSWGKELFGSAREYI